MVDIISIEEIIIFYSEKLSTDDTLKSRLLYNDIYNLLYNEIVNHNNYTLDILIEFTETSKDFKIIYDIII